MMITWGKLMTAPACQPLALVEPYADLLTARAALAARGDLTYGTVTPARCQKCPGADHGRARG